MSKDTRTPIERMIDQACGVKESVFAAWAKAQGKTIQLQCCTCGATKDAPRSKDDPKDAVRAVLPCPQCWPDTESTEFKEYVGEDGELLIKFYDKDGKVIIPSWQGQG